MPEFDNDGNVTSWFGTCFAEQATNKDFQKRFDAQSSARSGSSANDDKVDQINAKLGFDKNYNWFKVTQGMFTTLWLGISRTNVTIVTKDKTEEIGNYARSNFSVASSTPNRYFCVLILVLNV